MSKVQQVIILINNFSLGMILPVLNLILLEKGADLNTLPIIMAIYAVTVLCFELPSGICADLYGRKTAFLMSCGFQVLSLLLLILANNIIWLAFAIIFNGLSRSFASGSLDALIIDQAIASQGEGCLAKITSRLAVLEGIGLAVGGIAGGFISYASGTYFTNIILRGGFTVAVFVLCLLYIKEVRQQTDKKKRVPLSEHFKQGKEVVFSTPNFKLIFAGVFLAGFFLITIETYWQPAFIAVSTLPDSTWVLGIITFLGFIAAASGNGISHRLLHKFRNQQWRVYNTSRIILGICIVALALQKNGIGFMLGYAGIYLLLGTVNVVENTLINRYTPSHMRASVLSLSSLIAQIGVMCSSLFSSMLISRLHIQGVWIVSGILLGGYALLMTVVMYRRKTEETVIASSAEHRVYND